MIKHAFPLLLALTCTGCPVVYVTQPTTGVGVSQTAAATVTLGGRTLQARVADTEALRTNWPTLWPDVALGILPGSCVVLTSGAPVVQKVWMKDIKQPLDIVWVRDGKIVELVQQTQVCLPGLDCPQYGPDTPVDYVVDLRANTIAELGLKRGDAVSFTGATSSAAGPAAISPTPAPASAAPATSVPLRAGMDPLVVGDWVLIIPGFAWQPAPNAAVNVSQPGYLGRVKIQPDGSYVWTSNGRPDHAGSLQKYQPARDAKPGVTYWSASNGEETFYFMREGASDLTFYSPATDLYAANGHRIGAAPVVAVPSPANSQGYSYVPPPSFSEQQVDPATGATVYILPAGTGDAVGSRLSMDTQALADGLTLEAFAWGERDRLDSKLRPAELRFGLAGLCTPVAERLLDLPIYQASTVPLYTAQPIPVFTAQPVPSYTAHPIPIYQPAPAGCKVVQVVKLRASFASNGLQMTTFAYFWVSKGRGFVLTGLCLTSRAAELEPLFDQSASTVWIP